MMSDEVSKAVPPGMTATDPITVFCPTCGARPGEACIGTRPLISHAMRWVIADKGDGEDARRKRIAQEWLKP
jgi:hypothetical protein